MNRGLEWILTLSFGSGGNAENYLGGGWSGAEPDSRWMIGQASEIWLENPGDTQGQDLILEIEAGIMAGPPEKPGQRLQIGVRGKGIAQVHVPHGGTLGFHVPAQSMAAPGPVRLQFVHPDFRRPMDVHGGTDDRQLSFAMRGLRLWRVLPRPAATAAPALPPAELVMRFESLGDNCEFGLVQRNLGSEPLGLLRFAFIERPQLLRGLRCGFAGLGDPGTTEVTVAGEGREYVVRETAYGMTYHTYQHENEINMQTVRLQQSARLNFLRRKLMEDVGAGSKIFVIKRNEPLRPEEVLPIYTTLNELGCNWLLWMVPATPAHPSGTVERLLPGLLRGYVERFAPNDNAHDLSIDAWISVCEAAWRAAAA